MARGQDADEPEGCFEGCGFGKGVGGPQETNTRQKNIRRIRVQRIRDSRYRTASPHFRITAFAAPNGSGVTGPGGRRPKSVASQATDGAMKICEPTPAVLSQGPRRNRAKKRRADQAVRPWSGGYRSWPEMHPARGSLHPSDVLATMPQTVFSGQRQRSLIRHTSQRGLRARQV